MLPRNPLLAERKIGVFGERELMLWIEMTGQIRVDGGAFHNAQAASVVVYQHGDSTIGSFLSEPRLFLDEL